MKRVRYVYDIDYHYYEATKAVAKKAQKKNGFNGIQTHDPSDTSAMLYQVYKHLTSSRHQDKNNYFQIELFFSYHHG